MEQDPELAWQRLCAAGVGHVPGDRWPALAYQIGLDDFEVAGCIRGEQLATHVDAGGIEGVQLRFQPVEDRLAVEQLALALGFQAAGDLLPAILFAEIALHHQASCLADDFACGVVVAGLHLALDESFEFSGEMDVHGVRLLGALLSPGRIR